MNRIVVREKRLLKRKNSMIDLLLLVAETA